MLEEPIINLEDPLVVKYSNLIIKKYNISKEQALQVTIDAMLAYEAHGGNRNDSDGMIKVINVVVKSWLKKD